MSELSKIVENNKLLDVSKIEQDIASTEGRND
jgi:hypothetical protein